MYLELMSRLMDLRTIFASAFSCRNIMRGGRVLLVLPTLWQRIPGTLSQSQAAPSRLFTGYYRLEVNAAVPCTIQSLVGNIS